MKLPKARTENLLEQNLKNETLIYDLLIDKAFNLNETSTIVYKACGRNSTFDELKKKHKFTDDLIYLALDELRKHGLLAAEYQSPVNAANRREMIKKAGLASMVALPVISGLLAPKSAQAQSVSCPELGDACTPDENRQSDCCTSDLRCNRFGQCIDCTPSGESFAEGGDTESCNSNPGINRCCNSGSAVFDSTEFACLCP